MKKEIITEIKSNDKVLIDTFLKFMNLSLEGHPCESLYLNNNLTVLGITINLEGDYYYIGVAGKNNCLYFIDKSNNSIKGIRSKIEDPEIIDKIKSTILKVHYYGKLKVAWKHGTLSLCF